MAVPADFVEDLVAGVHHIPKEVLADVVVVLVVVHHNRKGVLADAVRVQAVVGYHTQRAALAGVVEDQVAVAHPSHLQEALEVVGVVPPSLPQEVLGEGVLEEGAHPFPWVLAAVVPPFPCHRGAQEVQEDPRSHHQVVLAVGAHQVELVVHHSFLELAVRLELTYPSAHHLGLPVQVGLDYSLMIGEKF